MIDIIKACLVGGLLCAMCQLLIDNFSISPAKLLVSLFILGGLFSAFGLYQPFIEFAGAGATVPLPGFGHLMMQGVIEAVEKDGLVGILTGGLTSAAGGICGSVLCASIAALLSHSHQPE